MKHYKPHTPSRRHMTVVPYHKVLTSENPYKPLIVGKKKRAGRSASGRISVRHQGGGHKQKLRIVDFLYDKKNIPAKVETIEYDPYRSGFIARVCYRDGERRYILVPRALRVGSEIVVSESASLAPGNRLPLRKIPVGTFVYNVEVKPMGGAKLVRGAGTYAEVIANDAGYTHLRLPSTEVRKVSENAWASIGEVSNENHGIEIIGKAGRSRWLGIRPTVRGSAMNPVDHPHGGGEGRAGRGRRRAVSMWGKPTGKGQKTRRAKKYSNVFIVSRRRKGKKASI